MPALTSIRQLGSRAVRILRYHGGLGTVRLIAHRIAPTRRDEAELIWYAIDVDAPDRPRLRLDDGLVLRPAGPDDAWLLEQFPDDPRVRRMTPWFVDKHLAAGATLWLVHEGDRAAYKCWGFRDWFPMPGARGGGIAVPPGAVALEDQLSTPAFRGRGVSPAALSMMADRYRDQGVRWMYCKINAGNPASHRSVAKTGFREVARMRIVRRGWWTRIRVGGQTDSAHFWLSGLDRG